VILLGGIPVDSGRHIGQMCEAESIPTKFSPCLILLCSLRFGAWIAKRNGTYRSHQEWC